MRQGEIWLINLDPTLGAEIKKTRPAIVVNDNAMTPAAKSYRSLDRLESAIYSSAMDGKT